MAQQFDEGITVVIENKDMANVSHTDIQELFDSDMDQLDDSCQMLMDDNQDDLNEYSRPSRSFMETCRHCKYCAAYNITLLGIVIIVATIVLVVITVLVVVPYYRVSNFAKSMCQVIVAPTYIAEYACSCGKGCTSRYPCIDIEVYVTSSNLNGYNASIHSNEVTLAKEVLQCLLWFLT